MNNRIIKASVQGATHKRQNKMCQDSHGSLVLDNAIIIAVADGHGSQSCPFSKSGSVIAVNTFIKVMADYCKSYANDMQVLFSFLNREGETTVARTIDTEWKSRVEIAHRKNKRSVSNEFAQDNKTSIWKQYGTTLLGVVITSMFYFVFQLGDGDIVLLDCENTRFAVNGDKILGIETHSLSNLNSWKKAITTVVKLEKPQNFMLSTDGFSNSYPDDNSFLQTCKEYHSAINKYGHSAVSKSLRRWLNETSENGSGDDITVLLSIAVD